MSLLSFMSKAALAALFAQQALADCVSFGMDFQDGGSYFQNSLSTDPFTFVSQFEGCNNDTASNIFVDPNGDQVLCSNTNLTPDDTNQMASCPEDKNELSNGYWSVVIISNNGNGDPIAYQRDFSLSVGPQVTTTSTPTVTYSTTITPLTTTTSTSVYVTTLSASTPTTTVPSTTITKTVKVTPSKVTVSKTSTLYTITKIKPKISVVKTTKTVTPSCHLPHKPTTTDKTCNIQITVPGVQPTHAATARKAKFRMDKNRRGVELLDKESFLKERAAFLDARHQFDRRAPDPETLVFVDLNTSDYPTITSTYTEATLTATVVAYSTSSTTVTPPAVTVIKGKTKAPNVTTTLPTPTRTIVKYTVKTTTVSTTYYPTVTITKKTTPASLKSACKTAGGILY